MLHFPGWLAVFLACAGYVSTQSQRGPTSARRALQQVLQKRIDADVEADGNMVFSPMSVGSALYLLKLAAGGESLRELEGLMGRGFTPTVVKDRDQPGTRLNTFAAFYYDTGLEVKRQYSELVRRLGARVEQQPFSRAPSVATDNINRQVARQTAGKITDLLPPGDATRAAVLISAIYFRSDWQQEFDRRATRPADFHVTQRLTRRVPMMRARGQYNFYSSSPRDRTRFQAVALPYKDQQFQMVLVLPDNPADISSLAGSLDVDAVYKDMRFETVELQFPKFRVESKLDLSNILKSLGVRSVFSSRADLTRMSADPRLFVDRVVHSAVIEVDERGSEAAAATGVVIQSRSFIRPRVHRFLADRPFLFYLYDTRSASVLFSGRIADPSRSEGGSRRAGGGRLGRRGGMGRRPSSRRQPPPNTIYYPFPPFYRRTTLNPRIIFDQTFRFK